MSKFTDANMSALKHLTSRQFFEVWSNYDQDGEYRSSDSSLRIAKQPKLTKRISSGHRRAQATAISKVASWTTFCASSSRASTTTTTTTTTLTAISR